MSPDVLSIDSEMKFIGEEDGDAASPTAPSPTCAGAPPPPPLWPAILILFLHFLSLAITIPVYPQLCQRTSFAVSLEYPDGDPAKGQQLFSYSTATNAFFEFVSAFFLGLLSDAYGRKPFAFVSQVPSISLLSLLCGG